MNTPTLEDLQAQVTPFRESDIRYGMIVNVMRDPYMIKFTDNGGMMLLDNEPMVIPCRVKQYWQKTVSYKIVLEPLEPYAEYFSFRSYYTSDFCGMVNDGRIKIRSWDGIHPLFTDDYGIGSSFELAINRYKNQLDESVREQLAALERQQYEIWQMEDGDELKDELYDICRDIKQGLENYVRTHFEQDPRFEVPLESAALHQPENENIDA